MKSLLIIVALLACSVQSKHIFSRGSTSFKKVFSAKSDLPKTSFSDFVAKTAAGPWQAALRTIGNATKPTYNNLCFTCGVVVVCLIVSGSSPLQSIPPQMQALGIISVAVGVLSL